MIYKKANFGNTNGIMVCEFGKGTIGMIGSEKTKDGYVALAFKGWDEPHPINVIEKHPYKNFDEMGPELVFVFSNADGIDSLISMLNDCKNDLLKNNDK